MTNQITIPRETWDATLEALQIAHNITLFGQAMTPTEKAAFDQMREALEWADNAFVEGTPIQKAISEALTASKAVSESAIQPHEGCDSLGIPLSCGGPLCSPKQHHPLCKEYVQPVAAKAVTSECSKVTSEYSEQPQECTRSHPHELMNGYCQLRTEIARLTNENARLKAVQPQAQEPAITWPQDAAEIREFIGSNFNSRTEDEEPSDNDQYSLTAHDLLSAFSEWVEFVDMGELKKRRNANIKSPESAPAPKEEA